MSAIAKPPNRELAAQNLTLWNAAPPGEAAEAILPCNGSRAWASGMAARRPLPTAEALSAAADEVWAGLSRAEQKQAFDSHPRLGESLARASRQSLDWSLGEQSRLTPEDAARTALALGNKAYEERFGRIFLLCATGKDAAEMLAILEQRLRNDPATEWQAAAEEQRRITQLRLLKWLGVNQSTSAQEGVRSTE